jgi:hypothetical protein
MSTEELEAKASKLAAQDPVPASWNHIAFWHLTSDIDAPTKLLES